jgi:hypothetical protein
MYTSCARQNSVLSDRLFSSDQIDRTNNGYTTKQIELINRLYTPEQRWEIHQRDERCRVYRHDMCIEHERVWALTKAMRKSQQLCEGGDARVLRQKRYIEGKIREHDMSKTLALQRMHARLHRVAIEDPQNEGALIQEVYMQKKSWTRVIMNMAYHYNLDDVFGHVLYHSRHDPRDIQHLDSFTLELKGIDENHPFMKWFLVTTIKEGSNVSHQFWDISTTPMKCVTKTYRIPVDGIIATIHSNQ